MRKEIQSVSKGRLVTWLVKKTNTYTHTHVSVRMSKRGVEERKKMCAIMELK